MSGASLITVYNLRIFLSKLTESGSTIFEMPSRNLPEWTSEAAKVRSYGESSLAVFKNTISPDK